MEELAKLREQFLKTAADFGPMTLHDAVVLDVNAEDFTCDIELGEIRVYGVRLRAVVSDNQSIDVLPKVGTQVIVGKIDEGDYIVFSCDEISLYRVTTGLTVLTMDTTGVLIQKGEESLKKILTDLVNGVLSVAAPKDVPTITRLVLRINDLLK